MFSTSITNSYIKYQRFYKEVVHEEQIINPMHIQCIAQYKIFHWIQNIQLLLCCRNYSDRSTIRFLEPMLKYKIKFEIHCSFLSNQYHNWQILLIPITDCLSTTKLTVNASKTTQ